MGGTLSLGPLAWDLVLLALPHFLLIFRFPLVMGFIGLTMIFSSIVFADKRHVAPPPQFGQCCGPQQSLKV